MNIQQRLTALERQTASDEPHGIPIKPSDWTDGEHMAVVKGLGLYGFPILTLCNEVFIAKYQTYIDKIRADYKEGTSPSKPLIKVENKIGLFFDASKYVTHDDPVIQAKPVSFGDIVEHQRAKYDL